MEGLAPTLKNLPPYYQHLAKGKIFPVVQELECQTLFCSPATAHSSRDSWDDPQQLYTLCCRWTLRPQQRKLLTLILLFNTPATFYTCFIL